MHSSVMTWVAQQVNHLSLAQRQTLEVGSLNVNGSARELFNGHYIGVDMRPGPGVDIVRNAHDLTLQFGTHAFEAIVCTEMLEHDDQPWTSVEQMHEVAAPSAVLLLTARGYDQRGCFPLHDYPSDLWRFSAQGMRALLEHGGWHVESVQADPEAPGVFVLGYA
jgi:SAM-dependent methyltransferase